MVSLGHKQASPNLAVRIQAATNGAVTVADLRPDLAAAMEAAGYTRRASPSEKAA